MVRSLLAKDYFKFTIASTGVPGDYVELDTNSYAGNLLVQILNPDGSVRESTTNVLDFEQLSLDGLAAATYYVVVMGATSSVTNPSYVLTIVPPAPPQPDFAEVNKSPATAFDLGSASNAATTRLGGYALSAAGSYWSDPLQ
jgi:hypothetical protein